MIEITAGVAEVRGGGFQSRDTLTQSTATTTQALSLNTNYSLLTPLGGTATGFGDGGASLADGRDGQTKAVVMTASGEMTLHMTSTATGALVFKQEDDWVALTFLNSKWRRFARSATDGSAT